MSQKLEIDDKYVETLCQRYLERGLDEEELHRLAQEGIQTAREKYDRDRRYGEKQQRIGFQSFATLWIRERFRQRFKELERNVANDTPQ